MSFCLSLSCSKPHNPDDHNHCQTCGARLQLRDRYRPLKLLGQGGFGRTFLAIDEDIPSKPQCVIKQLYFRSGNGESQQKVVDLFRQEAVRLDDLGHHDQIPNLLAHFEQDQQLYLVQELVTGQTLQQKLKQEGRFGEPQIWQLLQDILPVLAFIHGQNIIHRDIKPANIMCRDLDQKAILIDFGIAKVMTDTGLMRTGTAVGSPEFAAPEQTRGKTVPASDLYSLGVTCIHLMTQLSPFDMFDIVNDCWAWRDYLLPDAQVSDRLGQVLDKLIHNGLGQRYQSADEVLADLKLPTGSRVDPDWDDPDLAAGLATRSSRRSKRSARGGSGDRYPTLQNLLINRQWERADQETWACLCELVGKAPGTYLECDEIEQLPCEDLMAIDGLWVKHTRGHLGFSVQAQMLQDVGEDYGQFCHQVGWPTHQPKRPSYLKFKRIPRGHLPSRRWVRGYSWWRHAERMTARLTACQDLD